MTILNEKPTIVLNPKKLEMYNLVQFTLGEAQKCLEFYEADIKSFHQMQNFFQELALTEKEITQLKDAAKALLLILERIKLVIMKAAQKTVCFYESVNCNNMHTLEIALKDIWSEVRDFVLDRSAEYFPIMQGFKTVLISHNLEHVLFLYN